MPLANYTGDLMGTFPRLPYLHSVQLINRAWSRIRDIRTWSWELLLDQQIFAPTMIVAGSVSTQQFSNIITVDATAAAAINAVGLAVPPVASPIIGQGRQIRVGAGGSLIPNNWSIYNILSWDGISQLTIDKPFAEGTVTASPYQLFKCYYTAPANPPLSIPGSNASAIRFLSLTNRNSGYTVTGRRLYYTQEMLNKRDPSRGAQGDAYCVAPYQSSPTGQPAFEFYPCPVLETVYSATLFSLFPDISASQDFPQVPYGLVTTVLDLARVFACQWALANVATYPELQQTNWIAVQAVYKQDWLDGLKLCLKQDDEIMPQVPFFQGRRSDDWPMGGAFLQNHDLNWLLN